MGYDAFSHRGLRGLRRFFRPEDLRPTGHVSESHLGHVLLGAEVEETDRSRVETGAEAGDEDWDGAWGVPGKH